MRLSHDTDRMCSLTQVLEYTHNTQRQRPRKQSRQLLPRHT